MLAMLPRTRADQIDIRQRLDVSAPVMVRQVRQYRKVGQRNWRSSARTDRRLHWGRETPAVHCRQCDTGSIILRFARCVGSRRRATVESGDVMMNVRPLLFAMGSLGLSGPALAQIIPDHGHFFGSENWGFGAMMVFGPLFFLVFLAVGVAAPM